VFYFVFFLQFLFLLIFIVFALLSNPKRGEKKKKEFLSIFCNFGEIIFGIGLEHTNAKGTTCGRSVVETLAKKKKRNSSIL
jgi:preprotein translocase subunit SecG